MSKENVASNIEPFLSVSERKDQKKNSIKITFIYFKKEPKSSKQKPIGSYYIRNIKKDQDTSFVLSLL